MTFIAVVVTVMWAASVVTDIASPDYSVSPALHGIMAAVVGAIMGQKYVVRRRNGLDEEGE